MTDVFSANVAALGRTLDKFLKSDNFRQTVLETARTQTDLVDQEESIELKFVGHNGDAEIFDQPDLTQMDIGDPT